MKTSSFIALMIIFSSGAFAQQSSQTTASKIVHTFEPLPYAYSALEKAIDKETMEIHYDRHHRAYYNNFIKAIEGTNLEFLTLEEIFSTMSKFPVVVRNNGGGHYNHTQFWNIMSPEGGGKPSGKLLKAIEEQFGSFEAFQKQFEQAGMSRFGSGWVWLSLDDKGKLFISSTANQDNPLMDVVDQRGIPIFGVDVWEHAYYLRYQNKRAGYLSAFWGILNWKEIERRFAQWIK